MPLLLGLAALVFLSTSLFHHPPAQPIPAPPPPPPAAAPLETKHVVPPGATFDVSTTAAVAASELQALAKELAREEPPPPRAPLAAPPPKKALSPPAVATELATKRKEATKRAVRSRKEEDMEMLRKAAEMRAAGQDACHNNVFIVHWTHVPKAGGTAFASLAKRAACAKNPELADSNPCCVRDVCVAEGSCHSTASTCPFVQGIGKHTSNMGRLPLVPCCGREWYLSTVSSFLRYALRPAPTATEIAKYGLVYHADIPFEPVNKRRPEKVYTGGLATTAGDGRSSQLAMRARAYRTWPMEKRVEFFAKTGVAWDELKRRLVEKKIVAGKDDTLPGTDLFRLREIAEAVAPPANMTYGRGDNRFPRPGEQNKQARHCASNAEALEKGERRHACCHEPGKGVGANSMTMLRQPFVRAVSAFFYRGHSPNYDAYKLRPGLWIHPNDKSLYPAPIAKKKWTFKEFLGAVQCSPGEFEDDPLPLGLDEYSNILTKMFGDSESCPQARAGAARRDRRADHPRPPRRSATAASSAGARPATWSRAATATTTRRATSRRLTRTARRTRWRSTRSSACSRPTTRPSSWRPTSSSSRASSTTTSRSRARPRR